jgi:hypothetical protein
MRAVYRDKTVLEKLDTILSRQEEKPVHFFVLTRQEIDEFVAQGNFTLVETTDGSPFYYEYKGIRVYTER